MPLKLKPVPLIATFEIDTLVPPELVTVSDSVPVWPTVWLPKLRLEGFGVSVPGVTPVPDSAMFSVGLEPFDVTVNVPLALPADAGSNDTLNVALCPAVSVTGVVMPLKLKAAPVTATFDIETLVPPVLVIVSESVEFWPTV